VQEDLLKELLNNIVTANKDIRFCEFVPNPFNYEINHKPKIDFEQEDGINHLHNKYVLHAYIFKIMKDEK
jgi:hypothetical protein